MTTALRVGHVPSAHDYVTRIAGVGETLVDLDASPSRGGQPSPALLPQWPSSAQVDVVHLHFGFEHLPPDALGAWAQAVRAAGIALVVTVHDLTNPHLSEQDTHIARLDRLIPAAHRVLTLTDSAATEISARWAVEATVAPHPHLFPLDLVGTRARPRLADGTRTLGLSLGALRPSTDGSGAVAAVRGVAERDPSVRVEVRIDAQTRDPDFPRPDPALWRDLEQLADQGAIDLDVRTERQSPRQLWTWLSGVDALLLPYRWGTHSGWVESCFDVGTTVIAPAVGHWHRQHRLVDIPPLSAPGAPAAVAHAVAALDPSWPGATAADRDAEAAAVRDLHRRVYADAVASARS